VTSLDAVLQRITHDLTDAGVSFALIGGLAVSARTEPRFTRDADIVVAVAGDAEAEALVHRLRTIGYRPGAVLEQKALGRLSTVRLAWAGRSGEGLVVDLLFASSGIEAEIVRDADRVELLPSLILPVATVGHLIALKLLSRDDATRPQDAIDLRALAAVASPEELASARAAIRLISARGYDRGRDLEANLAALIGLQPR
jgi:hypothetical protein